jgi:alkanesulfonate monooxygenase SsuD/methylene tetrahydromethanopterin reductase-like flavin-dependent oxidoreductase (luciferase family)
MPGANGKDAIAWAARAEERGFPGIGASDRLVYPNLEPLVSLGAAAAVTSSVRMTVSALITPFRTNAVHMAKQVATLDSLCGGRLVLGVCIGGIKWDFEASGLNGVKRGKIIEEQIKEMRTIWSGEDCGTGGPVGPAATQPGGPRLLYGGYAPPAIKRGAELTDGWLGGGATSDFARGAETFDRYWNEFGREGKPWKAAHRYFALGPDAEEIGRRYVEHYYSPDWAGHYTEWMIERLLTTPEKIRQAAKEFADAGCDDMVLFPTTTDIEQLDRLADALA